MLHAAMLQQLEKDEVIRQNRLLYFAFPEDVTWRAQWVAKVGRIDPAFNPNTMHVCSVATVDTK